MKKTILSAVLGASLAFSATAQEENAGGLGSVSVAGGTIAVETIVAATVFVGVVAGAASNSSGTSAPNPDPDPDPEPVPTCEGDDPLSNGVCTGTTTTVTVSGTTTATATVTFTYLPTLQ